MEERINRVIEKLLMARDVKSKYKYESTATAILRTMNNNWKYTVVK